MEKPREVTARPYTGCTRNSGFSYEETALHNVTDLWQTEPRCCWQEVMNEKSGQNEKNKIASGPRTPPQSPFYKGIQHHLRGGTDKFSSFGSVINHVTKRGEEDSRSGLSTFHC